MLGARGALRGLRRGRALAECPVCLAIAGRPCVGAGLCAARGLCWIVSVRRSGGIRASSWVLLCSARSRGRGSVLRRRLGAVRRLWWRGGRGLTETPGSSRGGVNGLGRAPDLCALKGRRWRGCEASCVSIELGASTARCAWCVAAVGRKSQA